MKIGVQQKQIALKNDYSEHPDPEMMRETVAFLEANRNTVLFPKKYYAALKSSLSTDIWKLWQESPELLPVEVVSKFIGDFWEIIPGDKIVEMTEFILDEWEDCRKEGAIASENDKIRLEEEAKSVQQFFEKNKGKILLPHKSYPAVEDTIREKLKWTYQQTPDIPLNTVVITALKGLNPNLPGKKILELVAYSVKYWQHLHSPLPDVKATKRQAQPLSV